MVSQSLVNKLHPTRFSDISGKMVAIVGFILNQRWTNPQIAEMVITSDGMVLARSSNDCGCNDIIGSEGDLEGNWNTLLDVAGLTAEERKEADKDYRSRIKRF